jgi:GMP reductase
MLIESKKYYDYDDVLILPKKTFLKSRNDVSLTVLYKTKHSQRSLVGVPIFAANMDTTGTFEMARALQAESMFTCLHKFYTAEEIIAQFDSGLSYNFAFVSIGKSAADIEKFSKIHDKYPNAHLCIDVANGYTDDFLTFVKEVRATFPKTVIMAGNVATDDIIAEYDAAGVDIVKIGIGPGNFCRTRTTAGVGVPQLSAVMDTSAAADGYGILICADGGLNEYCDFAKAFAGGANFVMAGSMFAAHEESGGDKITENGETFKITYGMSSETAMNKYYGKVDGYRASEGRTVKVPYKGPVADTVRNILGSLRSTLTYTNIAKLDNLYMAKMIVVNNTINRSHVRNTIGN